MGFWDFLTIFFLVDSFLFYRGYDTFFWGHKTTEEKDLQKRKLGN